MSIAPSNLIRIVQRQWSSSAPAPAKRPRIKPTRSKVIEQAQISYIRGELERISSSFNHTKLEDWYTANSSSLGDLRNLLRRKGATLADLLQRAYPEHVWHVWKFKTIPHGWWSSQAHQKEFFDWAIEELRPEPLPGRSLDRWYSVTAADVVNIGGRTLILDEFKGSLQNALKSAYPKHEFLEWKFKGAPSSFWKSDENRRRFFLHYVSKELLLDPKDTDSWYKIENEDIELAGGSALIQAHYSHSASQAIMSLFPEHKWQPWRFTRCPSVFWDSQDNQRRFLFEWVLPRCGLSSHSSADQLSLFYSITKKILIDIGGSALLKRHNYSVPEMCRALFPDHVWDSTKFTKVDSWAPHINEQSSTEPKGA